MLELLLAFDEVAVELLVLDGVDERELDDELLKTSLITVMFCVAVSVPPWPSFTVKVIVLFPSDKYE